MASLQKSLQNYADAVIRVGLNLRAGQRLIINNASTRGVPVHVAPFVREITRAAYQAGARYVDVIWNDEALIKTRVQYAPDGTFEEYSRWQIQGLMDMVEKGDAMLTIRSNNPSLLNGLDPERIGVMQQAHLKSFEPVGTAVMANKINWCVVAAASPDWAAKVFPDLSRAKAEAKLWEAIFQITRVDQKDPLAAWEDHIENLLKRGKYLTAKQYASLKYTAPGTNLTIGLPRGHKWISAREAAQNGVEFVANLPTEEVFTLPHREQVNGVVSASMPLSLGGTLIEDFGFTFENGRVVKVSAKKGEEVLKKLIDTDEGSKYLGEVSIVPFSSPISQRGHLFYDPLIDENAACHLAVGGAYRINLEGAQEMSEEQFVAHGGNVSLAHVDFMIGSNKMDIDGICEDGSSEPVLRGGEWAFDID
ncbi:MAG TPA: aminopeptidase [Anaerolineales bacterium]|nr:aminopeptidase [Anaerolineales bacterium]